MNWCPDDIESLTTDEYDELITWITEQQQPKAE